jgi:hypothetical protein
MKCPSSFVWLGLFFSCISAAAAPAHPIRDDPQAERVFQQEAKALQSLTTIQAQVTQTFYTRLAHGKTNAWTTTIPVRLMRPNYDRVDLWDHGSLSDTEASDGKTK